ISIELSKRIDEHLSKIDSNNDLGILFTSPLIVYQEKLKSICESLIYNEPLIHGRKAEEYLRHKVFCNTIQRCRRNKAILQEDVTILRQYRRHLYSAFGFYHHLISTLVDNFDNVTLDPFFHTSCPYSAERSILQIDQDKSKMSSLNCYYRKAIHRSLINMGDIAKYQNELTDTVDLRIAYRCYKMATLLVPESGVSLNQLGTLFSKSNYGFDSAYYYLSCLMCPEAFNGAYDNLKSILKTHSCQNSIQQCADTCSVESSKSPGPSENQKTELKNNQNSVDNTSGKRFELFSKMLKMSNMIILRNEFSEMELHDTAESVIINFQYFLGREKTINFKHNCEICACLSKHCDNLHVEEIFKILITCMLLTDITEKNLKRWRDAPKKLRVAFSFTISLVVDLMDRLIADYIAYCYQQGNNRWLKADRLSKSHFHEQENSSESDRSSVSSTNKDQDLETLCKNFEFGAASNLFSELSNYQPSDDNDVFTNELFYNNNSIPDAPPGMENDIEVQSAIQLALNLANFKIETDVALSTHSDDSSKSDFVSNSEGDSDEQDCLRSKSNTLNGIEAAMNNPLLPILHIVFAWISSKKRYVDCMTVVSLSFWSKMSFMLNLLPHENEIFESHICVDKDIQKILYQPEILCSTKWTDILLSEEVEFCYLESIRSKRQNLHLNVVNYLSSFDETILRIIAVRRFGYLMAGIFSTFTNKNNNNCQHSMNTNFQFDSAVKVFSAHNTKELEKISMLKARQKQNQQSKMLAQLRLKGELFSLRNGEFIFGQLLILDCNVLLYNLFLLEKIFSSQEYILMIPNFVICELDNLKQNNANARRANRWLQYQIKHDPLRIIVQMSDENGTHVEFYSGTVEEWSLAQLLNCYKSFVDMDTSDGIKPCFKPSFTRLSCIELNGEVTILLSPAIATKYNCHKYSKRSMFSKLNRHLDKEEMKLKAEMVKKFLKCEKLPAGLRLCTCDIILNELEATT
ncbi:hypothetical protein GJ496_011396, partial [Pomphorhynchus laevis]